MTRPPIISCIFCELSLNGLGKCCFVLFHVGYEWFMYLPPDSHLSVPVSGIKRSCADTARVI